MVASHTKPNAKDRKYIFCATGYIDEPIAMIDASGSGEDTYYYHRNRQFSIVGLTDSSGGVIERYAYTAYGEVTILAPDGVTVRSVSDVGNPYGYTGRRLDDVSGLLYFRARYHDPVLGRFLERDPLGYPDGLNTYAAYYVLEAGIDPSGLLKYYTRDDAPKAEWSGRLTIQNKCVSGLSVKATDKDCEKMNVIGFSKWSFESKINRLVDLTINGNLSTDVDLTGAGNHTWRLDDGSWPRDSDKTKAPPYFDDLGTLSGYSMPIGDSPSPLGRGHFTWKFVFVCTKGAHAGLIYGSYNYVLKTGWAGRNPRITSQAEWPRDNLNFVIP